MRSTMRATAEAHGKDTLISGNDTIIKWHRDPRIAEAMVDPRVEIEGIIDSGKVLTFTPAEAILYGYCDGLAEDIEDVLEQAGVENYKIVEYKPTFIERIIGFLVHPVFSGLLIMAIIGGIYFEMQSPGIGFPLGIAVLAAVLYFAPLYLEGLAAHWEILVFVVGIILVGIEIFLIPGFGVAGALGILFIFGGLVLSLINNVDFDFRGVKLEGVGVAVMTVITGILGGFVISLYLGKKIFTTESGPFRNMALHTVQNASEGYLSVDVSFLLLKGKSGTTQTVLRPGGKVIIDSEIYDAVAENGFIDRGEKIRVTRVGTSQLYVEKEEE